MSLTTDLNSFADMIHPTDMLNDIVVSEAQELNVTKTGKDPREGFLPLET